MRVLGLVPARGGSKGVLRKNIRLVGGKPLLQYTAEAALASRRLSRVVLTTEDDEIARIGQDCGLEVPFMRPAALAGDATPMMPVVQHAIKALRDTGDEFDAVCLLQPTNPLRRGEDIDGAIALLDSTGADSIISFVDTGEKHPARMKYLSDDGRVIDPPFTEEFEGQRRQDLPKLYFREGSIYLTRTSVLMSQGSFKGRDCRAWIVPEERACNIDTPFDLFMAEQVLSRDKKAPLTSSRQAVEEHTGQLFGHLWHRYDDRLFKQSVELFGARWRANGEPEDFFKGKRCLDAGCGGGRFSFAMAEMGAASVVGVDVSAEGVADASRRRDALGMSQVSFRQSSLLDLPFGDGEFDFVCCSGVLHHTVSVERGLAEIYRVLVPGGSVYLLLYGAGGLYWPLNLVLRTFAQRLGQQEVDRCIQAAGLPPNKRRTILDDLFVPILETYPWERLEFLLRAAGFVGWRRWPAGQLDHESSAEALIEELRIRSDLWRAGAASAERGPGDIESGLVAICENVAAVARSLVEQHKMGLLTAEGLRTAVIGNGHHRLIAERS